MRTLKELVTDGRRLLGRMGLEEQRLHEELLIMVQRHKISRLAREAFDMGIRQDEGPIWFGDEAWKTDLWKRQWEWQKAYREGENVRAAFGDRDTNPYHEDKLPFTSRMMELDLAWKTGYDGEEL